MDKFGDTTRSIVSASDPITNGDRVIVYLDSARRVAELEDQYVQLLLQSNLQQPEMALSTAAATQAELSNRRSRLEADRRDIEHILQEQITYELRKAGLGVGNQLVPPVFFTFERLPKNLIISPRDRIEVLHAQLLDPSMDVAQIQQVEGAIRSSARVSAYITEIGGLGTYPAMVADDAELAWVLQTIAHEWVHNYLMFFPVGWQYSISPEMTTINETVAEIIGNEIGRRTMHSFYPLYSAVGSTKAPPTGSTTDRFDFHAEMRLTRTEVDRLLANGEVEEAEQYMMRRKAVFVSNNYPIRVLNQAYFAFHGSYGLSGTHVSPIGPQLEALRQTMPSLQEFLLAVRWLRQPEDLNELLQDWNVATQNMTETSLLVSANHRFPHCDWESSARYACGDASRNTTVTYE